MNLIEGAISNVDGELTWYASTMKKVIQQHHLTHTNILAVIWHSTSILHLLKSKVKSMKLDTWFEQGD